MWNVWVVDDEDGEDEDEESGALQRIRFQQIYSPVVSTETEMENSYRNSSSCSSSTSISASSGMNECLSCSGILSRRFSVEGETAKWWK